MNPSVFCLKAEKNTFRETKQINQPPGGRGEPIPVSDRDPYLRTVQ